MPLVPLSAKVGEMEHKANIIKQQRLSISVMCHGILQQKGMMDQGGES